MDRRRRTRRAASREPAGRRITVRIDKVVAEGDGLARDDTGKVVFVPAVLPGELVSAVVTSESKDYARAEVIEIVEASDRRASPPCPHVAEGCGGCDLQHASEDLQIDIKRAIVEESLRRIAGVSDPDVRVVRSGETGARLRTTVRLAGSGASVGFRRRRSHDVVSVDRCLVAHPRINEMIAQLDVTPGSEALVRVSSTTGDAVVWAEPPEAVISSPEGAECGAGASIRETIEGVDFRVSAGSFFQSSPAAARSLVESVGRALGPPQQWPAGAVIDAYGGVGLFSATVVPPDRRVVLVESNPMSCADARVNLSGRRADIVESRVEDWSGEPAAVVIADPARDGLRARAADVLASCEPEVMVLVSCDPASLGRDAKLLSARGYVLEYSEVLDVFPHTHHVEAVSRFVRSSTSEEP